MLRSLVLLSALWLFLPAPARAEEPFVPELFDVTGVAANDVLNIRAEASASAPVVGALAPDATGIEVTALDASGRWARIGAGELDGWVSMAYLARRPFPPGDIPAGMRCFGTEPFWSLHFGSGVVSFDMMGDLLPPMPLAAAASSLPPGNRLFGFDGDAGGDRLSGIVEAAACSDGMSDRSFGWRVVLLRQGAGGMSVLTGCCTLDRR